MSTLSILMSTLCSSCWSLLSHIAWARRSTRFSRSSLLTSTCYILTNSDTFSNSLTNFSNVLQTSILLSDQLSKLNRGPIFNTDAKLSSISLGTSMAEMVLTRKWIPSIYPVSKRSWSSSRTHNPSFKYSNTARLWINRRKNFLQVWRRWWINLWRKRVLIRESQNQNNLRETLTAK